MAKEVVWSIAATRDRSDIYEFWALHNKSNTYSENLESLFERVASLISLFPEAGSVAGFPGVRVKVLKSYKIFYRETPSRIEIIRVWDTRQNPQSFKLT